MEIKIYTADVAALSDEKLFQALYSRVSAGRREKTDRMRFEKDKRLSLGAGALLEMALAAEGVDDFTMAEEKNHKPCLAGRPELKFNLSHSGSMAAAAVIESRDERLEIKDSQAQPSLISHLSSLILGCSLGLDIQRITRYRPELVRRVFSAADRQLLAAAPDESSRERLFAQLWSRAEAYAKATGLGLQWPFPTPPATALFHDFEVGNDYCGSLCLIPPRYMWDKV